MPPLDGRPPPRPPSSGRAGRDGAHGQPGRGTGLLERDQGASAPGFAASAGVSDSSAAATYTRGAFQLIAISLLA